MNRPRISTCILAALGGIVVLSGCDQLTRQHFEMIAVNHAERYDVDRTLGPASDELPDMWHYERVDKHLNVMIHFNDQGKVWRKEWHDMLHNDHYDSSQPSDDTSSYESTRIRKID